MRNWTTKLEQDICKKVIERCKEKTADSLIEQINNL